MSYYPFFRGVGNTPEFMGLKGIYIVIGLAGLSGEFFLISLFFMLGISPIISIFLGVIMIGVLIWGLYHANNSYGQYGFTKWIAHKQYPSYIINRKRPLAIINGNTQELKRRKIKV